MKKNKKQKRKNNYSKLLVRLGSRHLQRLNDLGVLRRSFKYRNASPGREEKSSPSHGRLLLACHGDVGRKEHMCVFKEIFRDREMDLLDARYVIAKDESRRSDNVLKKLFTGC